jgi:hypothetical protein
MAQVTAAGAQQGDLEQLFPFLAAAQPQLIDIAAANNTGTPQPDVPPRRKLATLLPLYSS